jgi:hypothetical protein
MTSRLPERTLAVALLARATFLWLVLRAVIATFGVVTGTLSPWVLTVPTAIVLIGMVGGLSLLDARRRNEHRFLANLGVSEITIALLSMTPAFAAEVAIGILGAR